jgi:periplasmic protein TonB
MTRHSIVSPLGSLLDELREERVYNPAPPRPARARAVAPRAPRPEGAPEPDLLLESGVVSGGRARPARSWRWAPALALHAAGLVAVIVVPVFLAEELPSPAAGVGKVFFVPTAMAPPLPPPPPARRAAEPAPRKDVAPAPAVPRAEIKPEDVIDPAPPLAPAMHVDEGVPGGVDEGVPGGIVGGVLERAAVDESAPASAVRVGGAIKEPKKLKNVAPVYPAVAARGKVEGVVILEIAIQPNGRVEDVRVLRGIPLLDAAAVEAARQWVFAPTLFRGVPVSVLMTVSVRFNLTSGVVAS